MQLLTWFDLGLISGAAETEKKTTKKSDFDGDSNGWHRQWQTLGMFGMFGIAFPLCHLSVDTADAFARLGSAVSFFRVGCGIS